jgi:hypothetical protein
MRGYDKRHSKKKLLKVVKNQLCLALFFLVEFGNEKYCSPTHYHHHHHQNNDCEEKVHFSRTTE